ncbi:hypothetical protein NC652_030286 [Populus alba x Populus x berolinensis]|nr:hypothetical protein NC652_030286 [Populus alba x Populus x berolinensis]
MTATELNTPHASILEEGDDIITDDKNLSFQLSILSSKQIADNTWWECPNMYVQTLQLEFPQEVQHPCHPCLLTLSTQILDHYSVDLCYKCQNRKFKDVETVSLKEKFEGQKRYRHFSHRHAVEFSEQNEEYGQVNCSACGKLCSARTYGCVTCQILLHRSCFDLPLQIRHLFHPCPLTLCIQPNCFNCGACDRAILQSFYFYCKWCNFAMDIECALLPTVKAQSGEQFCHFTHGHPLTLTEIKDEDEIRMCSATNRKSSAPSYGCIAICPCIAEIKCVISVVCSN